MRANVLRMQKSMRNARTEKGLTFLSLANLVGVNPTTIWRIEKGATVPKLDTAQKIARALDMKVSELFPYDVPPGGDAA